MASFVEDLWGSVFTAGTTPALVIATNVSFFLLQCTLVALLFATHSIHFVVLNVLSGGLWMAINWFVKEMEEVRRGQAAEEESVKEKEGRGGEVGDGDGDGDGVEGKKEI